MIEWININLHPDLIKYNTDLQEHTTNNTKKIKEWVYKSRSENRRCSIPQHSSKIDSIEYSYRKWYLR